VAVALTIKVGDPRDRFWALLSLSGHCEELRPQVDYDLDAKEEPVYLISTGTSSPTAAFAVLCAAPHISADAILEADG
jgi:hypothetical protein